jgi:hypothetical protein
VSGRYEPYDGHPPHVRGSETSLGASVFQETSGKSGSDELRVLRLAVERGDDGLIDDEIEMALDLRHETASARRRGLVLKGCLRQKGEKRQTRRNCAAEVYVVTPVGRAELEDRLRALAEGRRHRPVRKEVAS